MAELWDENGTPRRPHRPCPQCLSSDEVGSSFDDAWCCTCSWKGSLKTMHSIDDDQLRRLRELAEVAERELEPGWQVQGRGIASGGVVVTEDGTQLCECYGGKDRFIAAEYIAALEPAVVLELIRRIEHAERPRSRSRDVDESKLGGQATPLLREFIRQTDAVLERIARERKKT
jgi:hypothetical protein